jgi:DNA polymerase
VYDIVNCGPRHRFVVAGTKGPLIVHNCVENRTQALSRVNLADDIAEIRMQMPKLQLVMTTHDEVVYLVPSKQAEKAARRIAEIMTTPPAWMPDLPLAVDQKISSFYEKE